MGVNAYIYLPNDVGIDNVTKVIGILSGLPALWGGTDDGNVKWAEVEGATSKGIESIPACANIYIKAPKDSTLVDGKKVHYVMYHFEDYRQGKYRLLCPPSTAYWIAIGLGLCKFFGGGIQYNDCKSGGVDRWFKRPRKNNYPQDGKPWNDFQKELMALKSLTKKQWRAAEKYAAYDIEEIKAELV